LSVEKRIVNDGSEEVESLYESGIVTESVNCGVVRCCRPDENIGVVELFESTQNLREIGLAEF